MTDDMDPDAVLDAIGFDSEASVLTRRQAEVLALRERGVPQAEIAADLGTSRANVSAIESSARDNVAKARETVAFAEALEVPVRVEIPEGTDLFDVPGRVYDVCDEADLGVEHAAPDLLEIVRDAAGDAVRGRLVREDLVVGVTGEGRIRVFRPG